jgi:hypothetical protein
MFMKKIRRCIMMWYVWMQRRAHHEEDKQQHVASLPDHVLKSIYRRKAAKIKAPAAIAIALLSITTVNIHCKVDVNSGPIKS